LSIIANEKSFYNKSGIDTNLNVEDLQISFWCVYGTW